MGIIYHQFFQCTNLYRHIHVHRIEICTRSDTCKFIQRSLCVLRAVTKVKVVDVLTQILSDVYAFQWSIHSVVSVDGSHVFSSSRILWGTGLTHLRLWQVRKETKQLTVRQAESCPAQCALFFFPFFFAVTRYSFSHLTSPYLWLPMRTFFIYADFFHKLDSGFFFSPCVSKQSLIYNLCDLWLL